MKALIPIYIFILSCSPEVKQEIKPKILTEKQVLALQSMNVRENAFMEECLNECYRTYCNSFNTCLTLLSDKLGCNSLIDKPNNNILDTAVGTAIGHGASKLLFGK